MTENIHTSSPSSARARSALPPPPTSPRAGSSRSSSRPATPSARASASGGTCACSRRGSTTSTRSRPSCWPRPAGRRRTRRAYPTGVGHRRALSRAARRAARDRAGAAPRRAGRRRHAARRRQAQGRRPRRGAVRARGRGARRGAALPRVGGDRRVGHVDASESARRGRRARPGRARGGRPDRVRHPGRARRRPRPLRRPARARRRQRPLGVQRHPRPRHAARLRAGDRGRVGDPRRGARPQVRRRRRRPAARARRARRDGPRRWSPTARSSWSAASRPAASRSSTSRVVVADEDVAITADEIIAATGFRPDLSLLGELRLDLDDRVEAARALAPLIDPNVHSCGSVPPHGVDELGHPDEGVFMVGMKSYGRAPTFLLRTGYEQVRSVVAALAGDWESARSVELVLPETGVCNRSGRRRPRPPRPRRPPAAAAARRTPVPSRRRDRRSSSAQARVAGMADAGLGHRRRALGHRDGLVGDPLLRLRRVPAADAAGARLLGGAADGRVLARPARLRGRGDRRRSTSRPPQPEDADDRRLGRRGAARARLVAGARAAGLLRALDRDRRRHGGRPLRAGLHVLAKWFPALRRAPPGDDGDDARRGARQLHLPAARPGADRRPRLA